MLAKKCNDMDTASLLIGARGAPNCGNTASILLALSLADRLTTNSPWPCHRASDIPARYVHGTIEVPINKLMNWVGGFTDPDSAIGFVASGGTPIARLNSGGAVSAVHMEHVWVEAYVDYVPSRGAVHRTGDTWLALDASYKQYEYVEGVDLQAAVPFDVQGVADQIESSLSVDPVTGAITNVNQNSAQTAITDYKIQAQAYIDSTMPNATGVEIIGGKVVEARSAEYLAPSTIVIGSIVTKTYASTPDSLRHKIHFDITTYANIGEDFSVTKSIPEIAGKRITLTYPMTSTVDNDPVITWEQMFSSPSYLLRVNPVLRINGELIGKGAIVNAGVKHTFGMTFTSPYYSPDRMNEEVVSGGIYSMVINPSTMSAEAAFVPIENKNILSSVYASEYADYYNPMYGEKLHGVGIEYFHLLDSVSLVYANKMGMRDLRQASRSIVKRNITVGYMYGLPISVKLGSTRIDVDRDVRSVRATAKNNYSNLFIFNSMRGQYASRLEGLMSYLDGGREGVSTMSILEKAFISNIPIYKMDLENIGKILPTLNANQEIVKEVYNAVASGKQVIIPASPVQIGLWTGTGYIAIDKNGYGAYMIAGGDAGASWDDFWVLKALAAIPDPGIASAAVPPAMQPLLNEVKNQKFDLCVAARERWEACRDDNISARDKLKAELKFQQQVLLAVGVIVVIATAFVNPFLAAVIGILLAGVAYWVSTKDIGKDVDAAAETGMWTDVCKNDYEDYKTLCREVPGMGF